MKREQPFIDAVEKAFGVMMVNEEKVGRAVYGMPSSRGLISGVGEGASPEVILAKYDQLHGYMTKGGYKVKHGTFGDKNGKPIENPKVVLLIKVNGEVVSQEEGTPETQEVKIAKEQKRAKKEAAKQAKLDAKEE